MADQTVTSTHPLEALIDSAFDRRTEISPATIEPALLQALDRVVHELNTGRLRVAEKRDGCSGAAVAAWPSGRHICISTSRAPVRNVALLQ